MDVTTYISIQNGKLKIEVNVSDDDGYSNFDYDWIDLVTLGNAIDEARDNEGTNT